MNKSELEILLKDDATPIYKLEQELGMPPTTLQKALTGGRNLPKKWALKLRAKFAAPEAVGLLAVPGPVSGAKGATPDKLDKKKKKGAGKKQPKKPVLPKGANTTERTGTERMEGESLLDYKIRMEELKDNT